VSSVERGGHGLRQRDHRVFAGPATPASATIRAPNWPLVAVGFVLSVLAAVAVAELVRATGDWNSGLGWERAFMLSISNDLPASIDILFVLLPWLSSNTTVMPLVMIACLWLWVVRKRADLALHLFVVDLGTFVLTPMLKMMYERPRPDLWDHRGQYAWSSYPSGHALIGVAVFATIAVIAYRERGARWPAGVLAVLLAISLYSRIYLGVHWPIDVLGGVAVGAVWLAFTLKAFPAAPRRTIDEVGTTS
jgi:undecaprenyl-diphosphatase